MNSCVAAAASTPGLARGSTCQVSGLRLQVSGREQESGFSPPPCHLTPCTCLTPDTSNLSPGLDIVVGVVAEVDAGFAKVADGSVGAPLSPHEALRMLCKVAIGVNLATMYKSLCVFLPAELNIRNEGQNCEAGTA